MVWCVHDDHSWQTFECIAVLLGRIPRVVAHLVVTRLLTLHAHPATFTDNHLSSLPVWQQIMLPHVVYACSFVGLCCWFLDATSNSKDDGEGGGAKAAANAFEGQDLATTRGGFVAEEREYFLVASLGAIAWVLLSAITTPAFSLGLTTMAGTCSLLACVQLGRCNAPQHMCRIFCGLSPSPVADSFVTVRNRWLNSLVERYCRICWLHCGGDAHRRVCCLCPRGRFAETLCAGRQNRRVRARVTRQCRFGWRGLGGVGLVEPGGGRLLLCFGPPGGIPHHSVGGRLCGLHEHVLLRCMYV